MPQVRATNLKTLPQRSPLGQAVRGFLLDRQAHGCAPATLYWYGRYVGALESFLAERSITDLAQVTPHLLREYLVDLQNDGKAARTVHHHASAARAFFNWCVADEFLTVSPMLRVRMPKLPQEILPAFTESEIAALLAACDSERDRAMLLVLLDTGARLAEFVRLRVGDVDLTSGEILIRQGKGHKDRRAFLGQQARKALRRYLTERGRTSDADPLWQTERGARGLTARGLQRFFQRLGARAGVPHCHAHTFRRTFAMTCLRNGMDLATLRRLMGHADLKVLLLYLDQNAEDLREAHRTAGPVDSLLTKGSRR